ncbi:EFR1 family ferrodoxin [uncultured Clostridium sp.]|uniref:EFR1 family ferrodoxin n=1 Tax=uncultured Clostridium sp. TaxID=59620 RepID=UPI00262E391F|nr:EFR1 family ferrodoxin [uncultured Clostridium sp.]
MKIFYFTGTGNSLAVAKRFEGELISIPQIINEKNLSYKDEVIGVVFPTYGWNVPKIVREFLKKAKLEANYIFAINTYGMVEGGTGKVAETIAEECGYHFDYINSIMMLDNYQPSFDIAKEKEKLPKKNVEENLTKIVEDIKGKKKLKAKNGLGRKAGTWIMSNVLNFEKSDYAKQYTVDDNCVKCGICAKVCPKGNIKVTDYVEFFEDCVCCQACIHACPKKAIHLKKEKSIERWRNPEVKLSEIIDANNQSK